MGRILSTLLGNRCRGTIGLQTFKARLPGKPPVSVAPLALHDREEGSVYPNFMLDLDVGYNSGSTSNIQQLCLVFWSWAWFSAREQLCGL